MVMELKDLVGEHELSGLDSVIEKAKDVYSEDSAAFIFILDGVTYKAVENPEDGYRSYLNHIEVAEGVNVSYTFSPQKVIGKMKEDGEYGSVDVIQFIDALNGKVVLEIGTDSSDDHYPFCVMNWSPETLSINAQ